MVGAGNPPCPGTIAMDDAAVVYVGFWLRVWASVIDTVWLSLVILPLVYLVYGPDTFALDAALIRGPADLLISWLMPAAAVMLFWLLRRATPGKMAIAAQVVDASSGAALTPGQALIRYAGYFLALMPLGAGLIAVAFDPRKQGWHDRLAHTVVVRKATPATAGVDRSRTPG